MSNNTIYLLCATDWEYNDEAFWPTEGCHPIQASTDLAAIETEAKALELNAWVSLEDFYEYVRDDYDRAVSILNEVFPDLNLPEGDDLYTFQIPKDATPEQIEKLEGLFGFSFYQIRYVPLK